MKTITSITYLVFALCGLACFALTPATNAQCREFCDGSLNTARGFDAFVDNTPGSENTATGAGALFTNSTGNDNTGHR